MTLISEPTTAPWFERRADLARLAAHPDPEAAERKRVVLALLTEIGRAAHSGSLDAEIAGILDRWTTPDFIERDPRMGVDRDSVASFFSAGGFAVEPPEPFICLTESEGSLVAVVTRHSAIDPVDPSSTYDLFFVNFWSVEDSLVTGHWTSGEDYLISSGHEPERPKDAATPGLSAPAAPSAGPGFIKNNGIHEIEDPALFASWFDRADYLASLVAHTDESTAAQKRTVVEFQAALARAVRTGTVDEQIDAILERSLPEDYIQNDANIEHGRPPLAAFFRQGGLGDTPPAAVVALSEPGSGMVATMSTIPVPDPARPGKLMDLFICSGWRVENGLIAEHWASRSKLPALPA